MKDISIDLSGLNCDSMRSIADYCNLINDKHGFNDDWEGTANQIIGKLFLINSEVSEAGEETRDDRLEMWFQENGKPEGLVTELADIVVRTVTLAHMLGLNIHEAMEAKIKYNNTRPFNHGRVAKI